MIGPGDFNQVTRETVATRVRQYYRKSRVFRIESEAGCGDVISNLCGVVIFADEPVARWLGRYWDEVTAALEQSGGRWEDLGADGPDYWTHREALRILPAGEEQGADHPPGDGDEQNG